MALSHVPLLVNIIEHETTEVRLGPKTVLSEKQFPFAKGDEVEAVGSNFNANGAEQMIVREVKNEDKPLALQDKNV